MKKFVLLVILSVLAGCNRPTATDDDDKQLIITSTIPIKYFVDKIAGDKWEVMAMLPSGANHSSYEPTIRDLKAVSDAKIFFETGNIGFEEAWMKRFKAISRKCEFMDVSDGIKKIGGHYHDGEYHGADPHYWLSPRECLRIAYNIYSGVSNIDTINKNVYYENFKSVCQEIVTTDKAMQMKIGVKKGKSFLIYHPALTYLADRYGLNQIAIEEEGKEPTASHIAEIIKIAKAKNINIILYQQQYTGASVHNIAKEIGATPVSFDPMEYNWSENLLSIANELAK